MCRYITFLEESVQSQTTITIHLIDHVASVTACPKSALNVPAYALFAINTSHSKHTVRGTLVILNKASFFYQIMDIAIWYDVLRSAHQFGLFMLRHANHGSLL